MAKHRGHCRCESVVINVSKDPDFAVYCHCDDCRRSTGAPILAAVGILKADVVWETSETLARYSQGTATRLFCNRCGSPIAQEHESADDMTFFNTAFMDEPENFPPQYHSYSGRQLGWLKLNDDLPRHEKTVYIESGE